MKFKSLSLTVPLIFSGTALFLHGYLGTFNRYLGDDFCSSYFAHHLGIFRAAWFWYLNWSGRFSASILDGIVGSFHPNVIRVVVALTILLWLIILTTLFLYILEPLKNKILLSLTLASVSLFTLLLLAPDIRQSLYWGQGMRSVIPPLMICTVNIILWKYFRSRTWSKLQLIAWGIFGFFNTLVTGGFSETYAAFQVAALFTALLLVLVTEEFKFSSASLLIASAFLGAISALILIILAPGNAERQAFFPPPPDLVGILLISAQSYLSYILHLFDSFDKMLAIIGLFFLAVLAGKQFPHRWDARVLIVIPVFIILFTYICFPAAAYGTSDALPPRTQILPTYFFVLGLLALGIVWGNILGQQNKTIAFRILPVLAALTILLAASIHSIDLYQSRTEFIEYANAWDKTEVDILASKQNGASTVLIPVLPNWAQVNTPNDNPKFWVNICMSKYYDVQILAIPDASSQ